jgi:bifunctional oligoribonuclease and PAP phosphatase NrnA
MKKDPDSNIGKAVAAIKRAKKVLIVSHRNPDGDTIGCMLALGLALIQKEKEVVLLCQDGIPTRFQFLPGSELVVSETEERPDLAIAVDCGSARQMGRAGKVFFKSPVTIQVDHHDFGEAFGKIRVLNHEASAVGEIVYELIRILGADVTPAIATCLLTSIIIDTGSFRFSNVRPKTFSICSELMKKGIDLQNLVEESYWKKSVPMAKLVSHGILNAIFSAGGSFVFSTVSQKDIRRFGAKLSDADSVADDLRSVEGVKVAVLFRETEHKNLRVSLRSKDGINVALVARRFGGGGHHNSAGCVIKNLKSQKEKLLKEIEALV